MRTRLRMMVTMVETAGENRLRLFFQGKTATPTGNVPDPCCKQIAADMTGIRVRPDSGNPA